MACVLGRKVVVSCFAVAGEGSAAALAADEVGTGRLCFIRDEGSLVLMVDLRNSHAGLDVSHNRFGAGGWEGLDACNAQSKGNGQLKRGLHIGEFERVVVMCCGCDIAKLIKMVACSRMIMDSVGKGFIY